MKSGDFIGNMLHETLHSSLLFIIATTISNLIHRSVSLNCGPKSRSRHVRIKRHLSTCYVIDFSTHNKINFISQCSVLAALLSVVYLHVKQQK